MLDLRDLGTNIAPGISRVAGDFMAEAAGVCLESNNHPQDVRLGVVGSVRASHELRWAPITDPARRGLADLTVAAEWGAVGIAALLTHHETGYTVTEQSRKHAGSGFDYWLGPKSGGQERSARLEVSGVLQGGEPA